GILAACGHVSSGACAISFASGAGAVLFVALAASGCFLAFAAICRSASSLPTKPRRFVGVPIDHFASVKWMANVYTFSPKPMLTARRRPQLVGVIDEGVDKAATVHQVP
ncbi:hypothetical protein PENSOL_c215G10979, partial [Penicillium solitum]